LSAVLDEVELLIRGLAVDALAGQNLLGREQVVPQQLEPRPHAAVDKHQAVGNPVE
jgi:hypothetical protein